MIDKTALVDKNAKIHPSVKIGPYTVIGPDVEIDEDVVIHSHVNISGNTKIGKGSAIFIHLTKNYLPTAGCIGIKKKDMLILLKLIKKKTKIKINKF